jgi:multicomponent Na+:H+ antiporter subunit A
LVWVQKKRCWLLPYYKASFFLITGVIDYQSGSRDVTRLAGLRKVLFPLAIAGFLAALSSAGLPFTFGFIGKDLIYEATLGTAGGWSLILTALAVVTNILLLYAGFQAGIRPFAGSLPDEFKNVRMPNWLLVLPPIVLSIAGIVIGCFPALVDEALIRPVVFAMGGVAVTPLKIWHGFNVVLQLSGLTLVLGTVLYFLKKPNYTGLEFLLRFDRFSPERIINWLSKKVQAFSVWYTFTLHNGFLRSYILTIILFLISLLGYKIVKCGIPIYIDYSKLSQITFYESIVVGITVIAILRVVSTSSRLTAVAAMGVVGYCICLLFVFYSAPDLAMTQFTIDTLTVVLFVLVLFRLPSFLNLANPKVMLRDGFVAIAFGSLIGLIALLVLNEPVNEETSIFYAENAYILAKGKNVVNVILVDFRGFDTLFEITVLTIATLGVFSLLKLKISLGEKE